MTGTERPKPGDLTPWLSANADLWEAIGYQVNKGHAYDAVAREVLTSAIAELTTDQLRALTDTVRNMPGPGAR